VGDLLATARSVDFQSRAVAPARELGAYEALWLRPDASLERLAALFRAQPDALPSQLVSAASAERCTRQVLDVLGARGIEAPGIRIHGAGGYPARLRAAADPARLLYFQGNWDLIDSRCVAIVGTRRPSLAGRRAARELARCGVRHDFTVVAGLARGIDTCAHRASLAAGGRSIGVLGTPITQCYPPENRALQAWMAREQLLISHVPILRHARQGVADNRRFFTQRNALIAALCEVVVIVEAGEDSGTLSVARRAAKQGRTLIFHTCATNARLTWQPRFPELGAALECSVAELDDYLAARATHPHRRVPSRAARTARDG